MTRVAPVCSNCGGSDFVWANELKTGSLGGGSLSLRSRGELSLGTRICRACGHADLFLKDPSVLRMPHTWRPGEFTPIVPRAPSPPAHHPSSAPPAPVAAPVAPPPPVSTTPPPVATPPPQSAEPVAAAPPPGPPAGTETAPAPTAMETESTPAPAQPAKKTTRHRSSKPKRGGDSSPPES